jgi:hypothetical protein
MVLRDPRPGHEKEDREANERARAAYLRFQGPGYLKAVERLNAIAKKNGEKLARNKTMGTSYKVIDKRNGRTSIPVSRADRMSLAPTVMPPKSNIPTREERIKAIYQGRWTPEQEKKYQEKQPKRPTKTLWTPPGLGLGGRSGGLDRKFDMPHPVRVEDMSDEEVAKKIARDTEWRKKLGLDSKPASKTMAVNPHPALRVPPRILPATSPRGIAGPESDYVAKKVAEAQRKVDERRRPGPRTTDYRPEDRPGYVEDVRRMAIAEQNLNNERRARQGRSGAYTKEIRDTDRPGYVDRMVRQAQDRVNRRRNWPDRFNPGLFKKPTAPVKPALPKPLPISSTPIAPAGVPSMRAPVPKPAPVVAARPLPMPLPRPTRPAPIAPAPAPAPAPVAPTPAPAPAPALPKPDFSNMPPQTPLQGGAAQNRPGFYQRFQNYYNRNKGQVMQ